MVNSARLAFNTASGRNSTCGMAVTIASSSAAYVTDLTPLTESKLRARFYFNANTLKLGSSDVITIYSAYTTTGQATSRIQLRWTGSTYQARVSLLNDASKWVDSSWYALAAGWNSIEFEWHASTAAGANNGGATLWLNGVQRAALSARDNDKQRVESVSSGIIAGMRSTTTGTFFIEDYISRRNTYIGP